MNCELAINRPVNDPSPILSKISFFILFTYFSHNVLNFRSARGGEGGGGVGVSEKERVARL